MVGSARVLVLSVIVGAAGAGCTVKGDDADRFREAIPEEEDVALHVPGPKAAGGGAGTKGIRIANVGGDATARYYGLSRDMTNAVDSGTATILGAVWTIVHTEPTRMEARTAVWGPGQATALEPAVWRFTVNEIGVDEYDYVLEGRPRSGGEWLAVLRGRGFGKSRPEHKTGWFSADNDAFRTLDPARAKDSGTVKVTYDLTKLPQTIAVELRPGEDAGWADVKVTHGDEGSGSVEITALGDIDDEKSTQLEDIHLLSRWTPAGSGRADVEMKNGDLPFTVVASECWSETFGRVYYKDTVDYEPASGEETSCALTR